MTQDPHRRELGGELVIIGPPELGIEGSTSSILGEFNGHTRGRS